MSGGENLTPEHLERAAYVYVRQSSPDQVRHNLESQRRQYGLTGRARQLGFRKVEVIDEDLGRSGSGSVERPGFGRLLTAVCEGQVGVVLAVEASRLARNNREWYHLMDLCAHTGTLLADYEDIFDPRRLNDRLMLGLKGTMSEFELGLLRQRALEAQKQMIRRGEVLWDVAVGYVRTEDNGCELTPDRQVQEAVRGVFSKFREFGSARQVLLWYRQERLPLPSMVPGKSGAKAVWRGATSCRILRMLKNPIYAGMFAYGRTRTKARWENGRVRKQTGQRVPQEEWEVLIPDHHPGYITFKEYLRNQATLASNVREKMTTGAPREGSGLLAGLLRCGRCGRMLFVGYSGSNHRVLRYQCRGASVDFGEQKCISFAGRKVDQTVSETVLKALEPAGIEASILAWKRSQEQEDEKRKALRLALEKARYESDRRRRQYEAVEPENRLVAAELETWWNHALKEVATLEERLAEETSGDTAPSSEERERLLELGEDLAAAWAHPDASAQLKKRILRTVLVEIVADISESDPEVVLKLHWAGGAHTDLRVRKYRTGEHRYKTDRKVLDLVRDLAEVTTDRDITRVLNRLGCLTGKGNRFTEARVRALRSYHKIPVFDPSAERSWATMSEAVSRLGVSERTVRRFIERGILPARHAAPHAPWVIELSDLDRPEVQTAVVAAREGRRGPSAAPGQSKIPFKQGM
jgi:DNA invertase Pin-like site-specific DNA recombinase